MGSTQYGDIKLGSKDGGTLGTLKCRSEGLVWESQGRDRKVELKKADVDTDGGEWCQLGSKFQLRLQQANGSSLRFDGFEAATFKELKEYCDKTFGVKLAKVAMDVSGRNSGKLDVRGDELVLRGESNKKVFDLALPDVKSTQCNVDKNDLVLTFAQPQGLSKKHEGLLEMRFFIPDTEMAEEEEAEEHVTSVAKLHREVQAHVSKEDDGNKVLLLDSVACRHPRSTFEITIFTNLFKMHSNTYDFSVLYKDVQRLYKVPSGMGSKPGHYLVLYLDPPLRKGQTHYPYVVLFFESDPDDEPEELTLNLPEGYEKDYKDHDPKLLANIKPKMTGMLVDMVADILRFFASAKGKTCPLLQAKKFQSKTLKDNIANKELPAVKCSIGANVGQLYLMDKAFLFLERPPMAFLYEDVEKITFDRNQGQQKQIKSTSFDFKIKLSNGKSQDFNQIPRAELKNIEEWFKSQSEQRFDNKKMVITNYRDDDDEDEGGGAGSDDDAHVKNRLSAAADDDDSDEDDDDFEGGAGSSSSDDDDGSDDGSDAASGSDDERPKEKSDKKKKKHKKEKKEPKPKKQKKDPNEPKRAKSSYMLFCDEHRAKLRAEKPDLSMTDISKTLGAMWKELSAEDKKPFEEEAKKLSAQYKEDKAKYDEENPKQKKRKGDGESSKGSKKAKKDPNAPKAALSAYMLWTASERDNVKKENPDMKPTEIMSKLGSLWREMSAEDKKPWEEKSLADKARHDQEKKEYKASGGASSVKKEKGKTTEDFEKMADSDSGSGSSGSEDNGSAEDSD